MQTTKIATQDKKFTPIKVLIVDLLTLNSKDKSILGSEISDYIVSLGAVLHHDEQANVELQITTEQEAKNIHFFYQPQLSSPNDITKLTSLGQYHGIIAAATIIPHEAKFPLGGVRIGAGTGNAA